MKSTVPVGTGAAIQRLFARAGQGRLPLRLLPGVPQGGLGAQGLPAPRPRRDRRRRRLGRRRGGRALRAARRARSCAPTSPAPRWSSSPPTPSWPPRSRSSTRSRTSARRPAPTSRGGARHGPRRPDRHAVPAGGDRLRRVAAWPARRPCWSAAAAAPRCCASSACGGGWRPRTRTLGDGLIEPDDLEVLSWVPGDDEPLFLPVMCRDPARVRRRARRGARRRWAAGVRCDPGPPVPRRPTARRRARRQAAPTT